MPVHVALLAVPAVAAGFLQAFQFAFLLWPFNLALPLARHLPRACIALRGVASFYDAELRRYAGAAARAAVPVPVPVPVQRRIHRYASLRAVQVQQRTDGDAVVAHAMVALVDISY
ncbi:uncharacterized protein LOC8079580 [Sorghum bicolor]|uniref:uncharacterized protein LOC8079580 n=1 Tax=Sorghum bicolor TaxID=4558 RepID=UPI0001A87410|nr:uncharacterized protein LOC8079580 [Sorghum bicolor]|eukprot:XP_002448643.1 uncharacterized protein LOC8079580 [Sorghum bicolor]